MAAGLPFRRSGARRAAAHRRTDWDRPRSPAWRRPPADHPPARPSGPAAPVWAGHCRDGARDDAGPGPAIPPASAPVPRCSR